MMHVIESTPSVTALIFPAKCDLKSVEKYDKMVKHVQKGKATKIDVSH